MRARKERKQQAHCRQAEQAVGRPAQQVSGKRKKQVARQAVDSLELLVVRRVLDRLGLQAVGSRAVDSVEQIAVLWQWLKVK